MHWWAELAPKMAKRAPPLLDGPCLCSVGQSSNGERAAFYVDSLTDARTAKHGLRFSLASR